MNRTDYVLVETCGACPEQYDVYLGANGAQVGYLRLRHGRFTADYVYDGADLCVYTANPEGDGIFEYEERTHYLNHAIRALDAQHHQQYVTLVLGGGMETEREGWSIG